MNSLLDGGEQLEQELAPEPMMAPAAGSLLLHLALAACLLTYGLLAGLFHHNQWGNAGSGGAIQVSLTSALPLPSDQPPIKTFVTPAEGPPAMRQIKAKTLWQSREGCAKRSIVGV